MAERIEREDNQPVPPSRIKKMIPVLVILVLLIAALGGYLYHRWTQNNDPPVPETTAKPLPLDKVRVSFKLGQNTLTVNDRVIDMDVAPQSINERVMLPVSYVASALNCQVDWEASEQKVTVKADSRRIDIWIGKNTALVDGKEVVIDSNNSMVTPMVIPPGRTMVPLRFLAESLGSQVDWNQEEKAITITN